MRAGPIGNDLDQCVAQEPSEELFHRNLHRGLPFFSIVFCLGQFGDVLRGVAERDELATPGSMIGSKNRLSQDTNSAPAQTTRTLSAPPLCQLHVGT
jgi:hypothetical protein